MFTFIPINAPKLKDMQTISFTPKDDVDLYLTVNIINYPFVPFRTKPE